MTRTALTKRISKLTDLVLADPRWEQDDLSVSVLGMLLYGYALAAGKLGMLLEIADIDAAVLDCVTDRIGAATKWSQGMVAEANASAFDKSHHPGHHELIGTGHSYFGVKDSQSLVDNVFANIASHRTD